MAKYRSNIKQNLLSCKHTWWESEWPDFLIKSGPKYQKVAQKVAHQNSLKKGCCSKPPKTVSKYFGLLLREKYQKSGHTDAGPKFKVSKWIFVHLANKNFICFPIGSYFFLGGVNPASLSSFLTFFHNSSQWDFTSHYVKELFRTEHHLQWILLSSQKSATCEIVAAIYESSWVGQIILVLSFWLHF